MKGIQYDNAAQRKTYVGYVYEAGTNALKEHILDELDNEVSTAHRDGRIHIHDLEAYGQTYNCLQVDILQGFPFKRFSKYTQPQKIIEIINHYKDIIAKLGNEQSGGIGFPNFDYEVSELFCELGINANKENLELLRISLESFVDWTNRARERCGQVTYYVTLNIGLCATSVGRYVTKSLLEYYMHSSLKIIKPNIVFKVKKGINHLQGDINYDLFCLANKSTTKKMIPTYLLCDSEANSIYDATMIGIMGCRTKVVENIFGDNRTVGRINVACATVNLPRIGFEIISKGINHTDEEKIRLFKDHWDDTSLIVKDMLLHRYELLNQMEATDFPVNLEYQFQLVDFDISKPVEDIFKHGSLSIGFIGLSELLQILFGEKYYSSPTIYKMAIEIVGYMRHTLNEYTFKEGLNFTLLASSGEYISGRFPDIDRKRYEHDILRKEYYTNSFHIDVDSGLNPLKKVQLEGPFHLFSNGGCITYVEFKSPPLGNTESISELISEAVKSGVSYLGFNFPLDSCNDCNAIGTFDICDSCSSKNVFRVRRVSGYLEVLDYFTKGKKAEVAFRQPN